MEKIIYDGNIYNEESSNYEEIKAKAGAYTFHTPTLDKIKSEMDSFTRQYFDKEKEIKENPRWSENEPEKNYQLEIAKKEFEEKRKELQSKYDEEADQLVQTKSSFLDTISLPSAATKERIDLICDYVDMTLFNSSLSEANVTALEEFAKKGDDLTRIYLARRINQLQNNAPNPEIKAALQKVKSKCLEADALKQGTVLVQAIKKAKESPIDQLYRASQTARNAAGNRMGMRID